METIRINQNPQIRIWAISDTHAQHDTLKVPQDVDMMIHTGDESNWKDPEMNRGEFVDFSRWLYEQCSHIPVKLFTPGNHSTWVEKNQKEARELLGESGTDLVIDSAVEVLGLKIFMSPFTPSFGSWSFQLNRSKSYQRYSRMIPEDVDIVGIHGVPHGILDLTEDRHKNLLQVGDSGLMTRLLELQNLKLFVGGHIHSSRTVNNHGVVIRDGIYYANTSVVKDGELGKGTYNNGYIFEV